MSRVVHVTDSSWMQEIGGHDGLVMVDFWAAWCGPCKMIAPIIDQISDEVDNVKVCKLNVDDNPQTAEEFQITAIPTMLFFKGGKVVDQMMGFTSKETIKSVIQRHA